MKRLLIIRRKWPLMMLYIRWWWFTRQWIKKTRRVKKIMDNQQNVFSLLQATLDKFPKTVDGVTIVPGEPLFWLDETGEVPTIHEVDIYGSPMGLAKECYSTRELAEAALAAGRKPK